MAPLISFGLGGDSFAVEGPGKWGVLSGAWEAGYGVGLNGATAASWAAKQGAAPSFLQATATKQPTLVADTGGGLPGLAMDGSTDSMLSTLVASIPATTFGLLLAGKLTSTVAGGRVVEIYDAAGGEVSQTLYVVTSTSGSDCAVELGCRTPSGAWTAAGSPVVPGMASKRFVMGLSRDGSTWRFQVGGGMSATYTQAGAGLAGDRVKIGEGSGAYFGGTLCAVWLYSSPIADLAGAVAALLAKYPTV